MLLGEKVEILIIHLYSMKLTPHHTERERDTHIHTPAVWKVVPGQLPKHNTHNANYIMGNMESKLDTHNRGSVPITDISPDYRKNGQLALCRSP